MNAPRTGVVLAAFAALAACADGTIVGTVPPRAKPSLDGGLGMGGGGVAPVDTADSVEGGFGMGSGGVVPVDTTDAGSSTTTTPAAGEGRGFGFGSGG